MKAYMIKVLMKDGNYYWLKSGGRRAKTQAGGKVWAKIGHARNAIAGWTDAENCIIVEYELNEVCKLLPAKAERGVVDAQTIAGLAVSDENWDLTR